MIVAAFTGGPIRFERFKYPLSSFAIPALIGITAGLSDADDTGKAISDTLASEHGELLP
jgi:hypothetical protein